MTKARELAYPFDVRPRHWWQWLSPSFWKTRKIAKEILKYEWEHGAETKVQEKIRRHILYGEPIE